MVQISRGRGPSYAQQPACSHRRAPPLAYWEPSGAPPPGRSLAQEPWLPTPVHKDTVHRRDCWCCAGSGLLPWRRDLDRGSFRQKGCCSTSMIGGRRLQYAPRQVSCLANVSHFKVLAPALHILSLPNGFIFLQAFQQHTLAGFNQAEGALPSAFHSVTALLAAFQHRLLLERTA